MADGSGIEWTDATWNFVTGCTKVSPGCDHCYIDRSPPFRMAGRKFDKPGTGGTTGVIFYPDRLDKPLRWTRPRRIFVNSLSDVFHDDIPEEVIAKAFAVMALAPQHTFQVLTKRHARMRSLLNDDGFRDLVTGEIAGLVVEDKRLTDDHLARALPDWWPLNNVWLGVTVESQQWADIRIPALLATEAAVRFLSVEPMVGPVDLIPPLRKWAGDRIVQVNQNLHWVIVGGESGPGARPMHPEWARLIRQQCADAGVPYFFKQWGEWRWTREAQDVEYERVVGDAFPQPWEVVAPDGSIRETNVPEPGDAVMQKVGKKRAGRELDGRMYDEYPAAREATLL